MTNFFGTEHAQQYMHSGANIAMVISEYGRDSISGFDRYVRLVNAASDAEELIHAVSEYLASWPEQRIEKLQTVDGGWGPFDKYGHLARLRTVADVTLIGENVCRQLVALKEVGVEPNPELVELDQFFSVAKQVAESHIAITSRKYTGNPR
jgi:hypothetical protein